MKELKALLDFHIINTENVKISLYHIAILTALVIVTYLVLKLIKKLIRRKEITGKLSHNQTMAIYHIFKYFIIIIVTAIALESLGIRLTILIASSAALFVGIGLGIQHIFADIVSGFIVLFGKTIKIGDIIEFDGIVARVQKIGFRTSVVVTRDDIDMIIPNFKFTSVNVINWSYHNDLTRFEVKVGVAYGSDVELVKKLMFESAVEHPHVSSSKQPFVRLIDFGQSSLDFELYFWSENIFRIESVKSDIRVSINKKFAENNVRIPFFQSDIHIKPDSILTYRQSAE